MKQVTPGHGGVVLQVAGPHGTQFASLLYRGLINFATGRERRFVVSRPYLS
jgi:hypothetical protein